MDATSKVKLIDFGLSLNLKECNKVSVSGTPIYLSPEIVKRVPHSNKPSDIWAAAVCLYRCTVGRFPFKGLNEEELYDHIRQGVVWIPSSLSASLQDFLARCFEPDPVARQTAAELMSHPWLSDH